MITKTKQKKRELIVKKRLNDGFGGLSYVRFRNKDKDEEITAEPYTNEDCYLRTGEVVLVFIFKGYDIIEEKEVIYFSFTYSKQENQSRV